jgi:hypothetical protein
MAQMRKENLLSEENVLSEAQLVCIDEGFYSMCSFCEHSIYLDIIPERGFGIRYHSIFKLCRKGFSDVETSSPCSGFELALALKKSRV